MTNRAERLAELATARELLNIIVHKRKHKMVVRWVLGALFYYFLWHFAWVRVLFWIGLPLELMLLAVTLRSYVRLRTKIRTLEGQLELDAEGLGGV